MLMGTLRELEMKHLIALDAVATERTFARAAERLGYTQSAISQQIAALERIVGAKLFDRPGGPRPVELTPLGARLLKHGRDLLARVDAVEEDVDRFRNGDVGRLIVGAFQSVCSTVLPEVVARLYGQRPEVELRLVENDFDEELTGQLMLGALDLSFLVGADRPGLVCRPLMTDPFVLIARPGQFPAGPVDIGALSGTPMIGQPPSSCQLLNENGLRAAGCEPNYVFRSNDNGTVAAMVRAGMGVAVMPALCVDATDARIALHPVQPEVPERIISLGWRADRTLSPAAELFIALAAEVCADLEKRPALV